MIIPLPNVLIDTIIGFNITLSVLLLMVGIYLRHPSDLSTFPSLILIGTSFRLAISIATTRSILTQAEAGQIIDTFGTFVVGGNIIVGLVIFLIITIVQFIVITKGSERVAEVAARFCLDAMPGKQMSIDAEVRAGTIEQEEGNKRRAKLDKDNQFFGAMDGAMKFVKGDAIAGLIITAVNLIGGIAVGMGIHQYSLGQSVQVYSLLTVGDGLVAQVPALFTSMCAAIIITRVSHSDNEDLGSEIASQLASDKRALYMAGAVIMGLGLIPGFPWVIFAVLSGSLVAIGFFWGQKTDGEDEETDAETSILEPESTAIAKTQGEGSVQDETETQILGLDNRDLPAQRPIVQSSRHVLCVGYKLYNMIESDNAIEVRDKLYRKWHKQAGVPFPAFFIKRDNSLGDMGVSIEFDAVPAAEFDIPEDSYLLICDPELKDLLPKEAEATSAQWTAQHGFWVPVEALDSLPEMENQAVPASYAVMEAAFNVAKRFKGQLFSRLEFGAFLQDVEKVDPVMVGDVGETLGIGAFTDVIRRLVDEGVPLRPARLPLESLHQYITKTKDYLTLVEAVRMAMRRQICYEIADDNGVIPTVVLEPAIEKAMRQAIQTVSLEDGNIDKSLSIDPKISEKILHKLYTLQTSRPDRNREIAVVVSPDIRRPLRNFLKVNNIHWPVLSYQEISAEVKAHPISMIRLKDTEVRSRQGRAA